MSIFTMFRTSARELKNLRSLILAALLLAIHVILAVFFNFQVTESLRISIYFVANILTGCLFGPVMSLISAILGDILAFVIKPTGGWFFGWTLNAALSGLVYGMLFYGKLPQRGKFLALDLKYLLRTLLAITIVNLLINALLGTYWCTVMYGKGFMFYFTSRTIKNLVQIPVNTLMAYYLLRALAEVPDFRRIAAGSAARKNQK